VDLNPFREKVINCLLSIRLLCPVTERDLGDPSLHRADRHGRSSFSQTLTVQSWTRLEESGTLLQASLFLSEGSVVTCHEESSFLIVFRAMEKSDLYFVNYINQVTLFFHS